MRSHLKRGRTGYHFSSSCSPARVSWCSVDQSPRFEGVKYFVEALILPRGIGGVLFGLIILSLQILYMMKLRSSFETRFGQIIASGVLLCWLTYIAITQYFHLHLLLFIPYTALVAIIIAGLMGLKKLLNFLNPYFKQRMADYDEKNVVVRICFPTLPLSLLTRRHLSMTPTGRASHLLMS
jgi:hypothetical protein